MSTEYSYMIRRDVFASMAEKKHLPENISRQTFLRVETKERVCITPDRHHMSKRHIGGTRRLGVVGCTSVVGILRRRRLEAVVRSWRRGLNTLVRLN